MLQLGDKKISELYLGEKKVSEVYLGEKKIRPIGAKKREMNSNTLAYYPFKEDHADKTGRWYLTGHDGTHFKKEVLGYKFLVGTEYKPQINGMFVSYWILRGIEWWQWSGAWWIWACYIWYLMNENAVQFYDGWARHKKPVNIAYNKWQHLAYWHDGKNVVIYVNGELKYSIPTALISLDGYSQFVSYPVATLSEFIIESKARTPEEVQAYYNSTKWQFWL